ncbi:MAG: hypothetical protein A2X23_06005 [Chloroflexi bacterium GWC2_73_18]|nr:MAG: hypothetical protein A2X23_06005 [Chloroflexi bacterium GWC2_73_18]
MDRTDLAILRILQRDGRRTYAEIGGEIGLTAPSVHDRVKKLEARGAIRGYSAVVDPTALGYGVLAFISVIQDAHADWDQLLADFAAIREIEECHHIAGEEDYLLKVRARDTGDLARVLRTITASPRVRSTRTAVVFSSPFEGRPMPPEEPAQTEGAAGAYRSDGR